MFTSVDTSSAADTLLLIQFEILLSGEGVDRACFNAADASSAAGAALAATFLPAAFVIIDLYHDDRKIN